MVLEEQQVDKKPKGKWMDLSDAQLLQRLRMPHGFVCPVPRGSVGATTYGDGQIGRRRQLVPLYGGHRAH